MWRKRHLFTNLLLGAMPFLEFLYTLGVLGHCACTHCLHSCLVVLLAFTLQDPMDCRPPDSSVHAISLARILGWVTIGPPGDLLDPGIKSSTRVPSALAGGFFTTVPPGKCLHKPVLKYNILSFFQLL